MSDMHERDIVATDEMIRNLKAGSFRKVATGVGVCGALLLAGGASLLLWTSKQGNDPEVLKEALRNMPPLTVVGDARSGQHGQAGAAGHGYAWRIAVRFG